MKRLYLEYQPDGVSLDYLQTLQKKAAATGNNVSFVETNQLHVTLLHFGLVENVYQELRKAVPDLDWTNYMGRVQAFAASTLEHLPPELDMQMSKLALYGHGASVLVAELVAESAAVQAQDACRQELVTFLQKCGVAEPIAYMQTNHNFKHVLDFRPHISLLRNVQNVPDFSLQQENLHLALVPLGYDMRNGRYT